MGNVSPILALGGRRSCLLPGGIECLPTVAALQAWLGPGRTHALDGVGSAHCCSGHDPI
jgi:hypothetical protein